MLKPIQEKILTALVASGGELKIVELRALYSERGDGQQVNALMRLGLTEWIRPLHNPIHGSAIAIRITDAGRNVVVSTNN